MLMPLVVAYKMVWLIYAKLCYCINIVRRG